MLQSEIAEAIVREIRVQVTQTKSRAWPNHARLIRRRTTLHAGVDTHYWQSNPSSWKQSVAELEEAVRLQPDYAPAQASLR
jgi:hypothetical protein